MIENVTWITLSRLFQFLFKCYNNRISAAVVIHSDCKHYHSLLPKPEGVIANSC
jgi:hypothetical protein